MQPCNRSTCLPLWMLAYRASKIIILRDDRTSKPSQAVTYTEGVRTLLTTQEEMQRRLPVRCMRSIRVYLSLSRGWQLKASCDRDFRVRSRWKRDRGSRCQYTQISEACSDTKWPSTASRACSGEQQRVLSNTIFTIFGTTFGPSISKVSRATAPI